MGCGCGTGKRYAGGRNEEIVPLHANLAGLNSSQLRALEECSTTPQAVAAQLKRIRLGDDTHVEDADFIEVGKTPDRSFSDKEGAQSSPEDIVHEPPPIPSAIHSMASSKVNTVLTVDPVRYADDAPYSPKSTRSDFTDGASAVSADFDALGKRLMETAGTSSASTYRDVDEIWLHPKTGARLLVGGQKVAESRELLQAFGVACIVRCLDYDGEKGPFEGEEGFEYLHYPISWWKRIGGHRSHRGVARIIAPLLGFVEGSLENGRSVFIHCLAGAHRAGTAGVACIMHLCQLDAASAILAVQAVRPCVEPLAHLKVLLRRLDKCRQDGQIPTAIQNAEKKGFQKASHALFASLG